MSKPKTAAQLRAVAASIEARYRPDAIKDITVIRRPDPAEFARERAATEALLREQWPALNAADAAYNGQPTLSFAPLSGVGGPMAEVRRVPLDLDPLIRERCACEFTPYDDPDDPNEVSCHYLRRCAACGYEWYSLHCPHDGVQRHCSYCGTRPPTITTPEPEGHE